MTPTIFLSLSFVDADFVRAVYDHIDLLAYQLGRESWQLIIIFLRPPIFDDEIPTFFIAEFPQSLAQGGNLGRPA